MPDKIPALIAGLSTFVILILLAVLTVFIQMVALNGANERQGFNAMGISLVCQSVGLLLAVILARWLVNLLIAKFNCFQRRELIAFSQTLDFHPDRGR
jgi:hypothetical protein